LLVWGQILEGRGAGTGGGLDSPSNKTSCRACHNANAVDHINQTYDSFRFEQNKRVAWAYDFTVRAARGG
jgi:hypothetical protein